ncbi:hypothetical protein [Nocardia sp. NPDC060249]|uniref:hypothetical protein n=1 Tax=Nocardia sp. NPDC060249 TaxID=3347082 RepID=UPI00365DB783
MVTVIDYSSPGPLTSLHGARLEAVEPIPTGIIDVCGLAAGLVIQPNDAQALGLPNERFPQNQIRPVGELVDAFLSLDSKPLTDRREPNHRVIGTCRHFAARCSGIAGSHRVSDAASPHGMNVR